MRKLTLLGLILALISIGGKPADSKPLCEKVGTQCTKPVWVKAVFNVYNHSDIPMKYSWKGKTYTLSPRYRRQHTFHSTVRDTAWTSIEAQGKVLKFDAFRHDANLIRITNNPGDINPAIDLYKTKD